MPNSNLSPEIRGVLDKYIAQRKALSPDKQTSKQEKSPQEAPESSTQARKRPLRSRLGVLGVGAALLAAVGFTFAPPFLEQLTRANVEARSQKVDLSNLLQLDNKVWEPMPGYPAWRRTLIPSPDPQKNSNLPWELILLNSPDDNFKTQSSFPYMTRKSLMKQQGPINTEHGAIVATNFNISGDPNTPKNPLITDGGIIIENNTASEAEKRSIYLSVDGDELQLHYLIGTTDMSKAELKLIVAKLQSGNAVVGAKIGESGTVIQPLDNGEGNLSAKIHLPVPFWKDKPKSVGITAFSRKGFTNEVGTVMVTRPLP